MHEEHGLVEMTTELVTHRLLAAAVRPGTLGGPYKGGSMATKAQLNLADLLWEYSKDASGLELGKLSGLGELASQCHDYHETSGKQRQERRQP